MIEVFEAERSRLVHLAYAMVGSVARAEELVQEAWLRAQDAEGIERPAAWLTTVVSRLALDDLKAARSHRESYPGPWLPEPMFTQTPEDDTALAEAVQLATMVVLEQLDPTARAAFLLHEVFDVGYPELAGHLQRSEAAVRQIVHRARVAVKEKRRAPHKDPAGHAEVLGRFSWAILSGDLAGVQALLAEDCVFISDGGGRVSAAMRPVSGALHVAKMLVGLQRKADPAMQPHPVTLNHQPAVIFTVEGVPISAMVFTVQDGRVAAIFTVRNPSKLLHLVPGMLGG